MREKAVLILVMFLVVLISLLPSFYLLNHSLALAIQLEGMNGNLTETFFTKDGHQLDLIIVSGKPPVKKAEIVDIPEALQESGINVLSSVPAFDWSYGCSATSAAMLFGYYDNNEYPDMYTGPTNDGVCPLNNSVWGHTEWPSVTCGETPLSASHNGIDGRTDRGHVDDYWIDYGDSGPDPYIVNGWIEHAGGCTADFMGTNQSKYSNSDGSTIFFFDRWGDPVYDFTGYEPTYRDGCYGMRLFAESRGYSVNINFSQYIKGQAPNNKNKGFTFEDFKNEIDAGRPVLIHVTDHTMLGYGYNETGQIVYIHDTWDYSDHQMTWGGKYEGLQHYGVTVFRLTEENPPALHHFAFNTIPNQTAGVPFNITITAIDQYENTYTDFNSSVTLSVNKGSISPTTTSSFVNGVLSSFQVTIPSSNTSVTITATYSGKTGTSNAFDVSPVPPALHHFAFNTIPNQTAGVPFNITITAIDQYENTYTDFNSSVTLSVNKGSISPTTTSSFVNGVLSSFQVTIPSSNTSVTITATYSGKTGTSNAFDVSPVPPAPDFSISASPTSRTITPGSSTTYSVTATSINGFSSSVSLSLSGLPSGATYSFSLASGTPTFSSMLTINTSTSTPTGTYTLTINASGGGLSRSKEVTLEVQCTSCEPKSIHTWLDGPYDDQIYNYDIDIRIDTWISNPDPNWLYFWAICVYFSDEQGDPKGAAHGGIQWASGGKKANWGGYELVGGTQSIVIDYNWQPNKWYRYRVWGLGQNPDGSYNWGFWLLDYETNIETFVGSVTSWGRYISDICVFTETGYGVLCNTPSVQVRWKNPAYKSFATGGVNNTPTKGTATYNGTCSDPNNTDQRLIGVNPVEFLHLTNTIRTVPDYGVLFDLANPDFSISALPTSRTITPGSSTSYTVSLTSQNGFNSSVTLSASVSPLVSSGPSCLFSKNPLTPTDSSTMNVSTSSSTPAGTYIITITAEGGGNVKTSQVTLTVESSATVPTVTTLDATSVQAYSATLNGQITNNGGSSITNRAFSYGKNSNESDRQFIYSVTVNGNYFNCTLINLEPGTRYYFRAWAQNNVGWSEGSLLYFDTSPPPALHHFAFNTIPNQTAGVPFNITITAIDQYENTYTDFNSSVTLSVNKGSISPTTTSSFVNGVLSSFQVTIPSSNTSVTITATYSGKTGTSNAFDVNAATSSFTLHITPGYSLISVPFDTDASLLSCQYILLWDGTMWQTVTTLHPGTGYLAYNTGSAKDIELTGTQPSSPFTLSSTGSYQLIGNPFTTPATLSSTSSITYILYWDGTMWQIANVNNLQPGLGYLVLTSSPGTFTFSLIE